MRQATNLLLVAVLAVLLLRRLLLSMREQRRMAFDVKQAQEVQQVILPEARAVLPGFVVESEYRPARDVGGDSSRSFLTGAMAACSSWPESHR